VKIEWFNGQINTAFRRQTFHREDNRLPTSSFHNAQKEVKNVLFSKINLEIQVTSIEFHLAIL
jgi:hypothetical protein